MIYILKYCIVFYFIIVHTFAFDTPLESSSGNTPLPDSKALSTVKGYADLDTPFERVIGLGKNCLTKAQINLLFNPSSYHFTTKKGQADLFDWLSIENYDLFSRALENKLKHFFERDDFIITNNSHYNLIDKECGIRWVHLLAGYLTQNVAPELREDPNFLLNLFRVNYEKEKEKIDHLKTKFLKAKDKKTLYIISRNPPLPKESIIKVRDALAVVRDGNQDFILLLVTQNPGYSDFENIIIREAKNVMPHSHVEPNVSYWAEVFKGMKFTPDIWD